MALRNIFSYFLMYYINVGVRYLPGIEYKCFTVYSLACYIAVELAPVSVIVSL